MHNTDSTIVTKNIINPNSIQNNTLSSKSTTLSSQSMQRNTILYKNSLDCLKRILLEEGISKGLYSGLSMNIIRSISGSILLVGYDEFQNIFQYITLFHK